MLLRANRVDFARLISYILFALVFSNLVALDIWIYKQKLEKTPAQLATVAEKMVVEKKTDEGQKKVPGYVSDIYDAIREATASLQLDTRPKIGGTAAVGFESEFIITLGSGTNTTDDWVDVVGAGSFIDSTKYGSIKKVVFEATVQIPNGNQTSYVRLYNATDKHPVWSSEMSLEGSEAKLLISQPITLDSGNKLYQVQMKSQLKDKTNLLQSRVRITSYK